MFAYSSLACNAQVYKCVVLLKTTDEILNLKQTEMATVDKKETNSLIILSP